MKYPVKKLFKDIGPMDIFSHHGLNYIKMSNSHSIGCRDGKDHIFALRDRVEHRGHAKACVI